MLLGNAAAPRWYDMDRARLDQYIAFLIGSGAASAELALHHGPADARTARVHLLEPDWHDVSRRFQCAGLACQVHASLDRRFSLARWDIDRTGLQAEYTRLFRAAIAIGERQASPVAFVLHASSSLDRRGRDGMATSREFLTWGSDALSGCNVVLCPELRPARDRADERWDRSRRSMTELIGEFDRANVGICWDLGHDWENRIHDEAWSVAPGASFLSLVRHAHLHDAGAAHALHHPLGFGGVPWREQIDALRNHGYGAALTMEIRYRYARAAGEPWTVLAACYRRVIEQLAPTDPSLEQE